MVSYGEEESPSKEPYVTKFLFLVNVRCDPYDVLVIM